MREGVTSPVLEVRDLVKDYVSRDAKLRQRVVRAVDGVSFEVWPSETFAIVGESGSGKSTVGRVILKLTDATEGHVSLLGQDILDLGEKQFRPMRRNLQMVFQDPLAAFDPRATIRSSLREFAEFGGERTASQQDQAIEEAIRNVGLSPEIADRRPAEVSGGQLQRLSVARSLLVEPRLLFLDEPTSSLDVSIRGQIVNLLTSIQETDQLAYLLVAHDLRVVYAMAHRVAVMYLGQFVEIGTRDQVYREAAHTPTPAACWKPPNSRNLGTSGSPYACRERSAPTISPRPDAASCQDVPSRSRSAPSPSRCARPEPDSWSGAGRLSKRPLP